MVFNLKAMAHRWATEVFCSGPQSILVWKCRICTISCLLIWFEILQKVAVNGELTGLFFLEITWFWQKKRLNLIQDWWKFGSSSLTDVSSFQKSPHPHLRNPGYATAQDSGKLQLSNTWRIVPWKNFRNENGPRLKKGWETTALNWCLFFHHFICFT